MKEIRRERVVFVCIGNACRSPMAEAIARRIAADVMDASSAGLAHLGRIEATTKETLIRNGYSSDGLLSKPVPWTELDAADLVINMSGRPREFAFDDHDKVEDWDVEDPYGADPETYQRIFEDIERRVAGLADRLRNAGSNRTKVENIQAKGISKRRP